jgi:hypothetical protein
MRLPYAGAWLVHGKETHHDPDLERSLVILFFDNEDD